MSSIELWPKQQEVFNFACDRKEVALLCEQRTGKTFITLKLIKYRLSQFEQQGSEFVGVLVCLLNNKESTWGDGLSKFVPEVQVFRDLEEFRKAKGHRLLMVHFESLSSIIGKLVKYKKLNWAAVDEAHRLYNRGSKQSRAMARLSWVEWKVILTGTPMEKRPTDFFAQFKFLSPEVFGTNHSDFENKWLEWPKLDMSRFVGMREGGPAWQQKMMQQRMMKKKAKFREELMPEFIELLRPYCIRIEKTDVGIIPPEVKHHYVDMTGPQRRIYNAMKKDGYVEISGIGVMAPLPATKVMKLRQLAGGFLFDEDGELHRITSKKVRYAIELFESLPKPVVLFAAFIPEVLGLHRALEASGYDVGLVYGGTAKKKRPDVWRAFQRGQLDAVVCQTGAGGVGVDLWKANHGIMVSLSYSSIIWDQALARMDARGKSVAAVMHLIHTKDTIDEDLNDLIVSKGQTTRSILSQLKGRYSNGKRKSSTRRKSKTSASGP